MAELTPGLSSEASALRSEALAEIRANAGVMFRHTLTFQLAAHQWPVRCSVRDVQRVKPDELARLQLVAAEQGVTYRDLRLLGVHPDDTVPYPGATVAWDDGTLEVLHWGQASDFTGQRVGTAVLRRP